MKKIISLLMICLMVSILFGCSNNDQGITTIDEPIVSDDQYSDYVKVTKYCDRVFETGIYKELDFDGFIPKINDQYDKYITGGGCTAVGKKTKYDGLVIGRNMDLFITNKPSYIVRTDIEGLKKTFGLMYSNSRGDDYDFVEEHGVEPGLYSTIPFFQTDVMNEDGFYIEINMRYADYDEDGNSVFSCSGTLPNQGKLRINAFLLPVYLGTRCSTVDEAVKMAKEELDIFTPTPDGSGIDWNFCFMLSDATGKYGVLEIAQNKVIFNEAIEKEGEGMPLGACQANYYITPEFYEIQKMKSGVGRVDYIKEKWPTIDSEERMFVAMLGVSYFQTYFSYCQFNNLYEFVGEYEEDGQLFIGKETPDVADGETVVWDYDYISNPDNQKYVKAYIKWIESRIGTRRAEDTLYDSGLFWESTFTIVANPKNRTMFVRFNENNKNIKFFKFDEAVWD